MTEQNISVIAGGSNFMPVSAKLAPSPSYPDVRLLAPVIPRSKVVCIGKNYADHAAEMNSEVPSEPIIFLKAKYICHWPHGHNRVAIYV